MKLSEWTAALENGDFDERLSGLYGKENLDAEKERYQQALSEFSVRYGDARDVTLFSVPGRSELSGNHTDHNHGRVIAASVNLDVIAVVAMREDLCIRVKSEGHEEDVVDLDSFTEPDPALYGRSSSLIAGMANGFSDLGYNVGGFDAYTTSNVPKGSGLSSSAAFENLIGTVLNHLYNDGAVDPVTIAKLSQKAENAYFGKPCGLMDQVACAMGGIVTIDFADPAAPVIEKIPFDFSAEGYKLCIVNTGGNHADLTPDYAAVPAEMKSVARFFGKEVLREVPEGDFMAKIAELRETVGDRAILRALHFYSENRRVEKQAAALREGRLDEYLKLTLESGRSSFCYLQNVYTNQNVAEQGLSLALCLAETLLADEEAAWRVHGGGFAGTIQAFVPERMSEVFSASMEEVFGKGSCMVLSVRLEGLAKI
ncbi:MAG: galactokinase [Clostridia bacterium]|nr:galactokinase [Clostridia bacterium]